MCLIIRHLLRKARKKEFASTLDTGFIPLSSMDSAVVLMDGTKEGCTECGERLRQFLEENGVSTQVRYLDFRRSGKEVVRYAPAGSLILRKDISWAGIPKKKKFRKFLSDRTDLLVNLIESDNFTSNFFSECIKAGFKIGTAGYKGHCYDMIIENSEKTGKTTNQGEALASRETIESEKNGPAMETHKKVELIIDLLKKIV